MAADAFARDHAPERRHPHSEVLCSETLDMERCMAIIDVDVLPSRSTGDGCVRQEDLVSVGLSWFEGVGKPPRLLELEVAAGEALRRCGH